MLRWPTRRQHFDAETRWGQGTGFGRSPRTTGGSRSVLDVLSGHVIDEMSIIGLARFVVALARAGPKYSRYAEREMRYRPFDWTSHTVAGRVRIHERGRCC